MTWFKISSLLIWYCIVYSVFSLTYPKIYNIIGDFFSKKLKTMPCEMLVWWTFSQLPWQCHNNRWRISTTFKYDLLCFLRTSVVFFIFSISIKHKNKSAPDSTLIRTQIYCKLHFILFKKNFFFLIQKKKFRCSCKILGFFFQCLCVCICMCTIVSLCNKMFQFVHDALGTGEADFLCSDFWLSSVWCFCSWKRYHYINIHYIGDTTAFSSGEKYFADHTMCKFFH